MRPAGRTEGERGAISPLVFIMLFFLSLIGFGVSFLIASVSVRMHRTALSTELDLQILRQSERFIRLLSEDPTPGADSALDPVWIAHAGDDREGCRVELRDVSSLINPNWVQKNLLMAPGLENLLLPGRTPEDLQAYREEKGFSLEIGTGYREFFGSEDVSAYLTPYGYANVNVTDEFSLRRLAYLRTGSAVAADTFHERIRAALRSRTIIGREQLRESLGDAWERLIPVVNAEPVYNVHFLPERILSGVLFYPAFEVENPQERLSRILSARMRSELSENDLSEILGKDESARIRQYLGVVTWFWLITVEKDNRTLRVVLARLPPESSSGGERSVFRIVEKRFIR